MYGGAGRGTGQAGDRASGPLRRRWRTRLWVWLGVAACAFGVLPIVLALTVHDHGFLGGP